MNKLKLALAIAVVVGLAGREVYWRLFAGNTVYVFADDNTVTVHVDDEPQRTIAPFQGTIYELAQGEHVLTLTASGLTETRRILAENNDHLVTAPPGRCMVDVDVTLSVYFEERTEIQPNAIHPPGAFATHYSLTGRTFSQLPESVSQSSGVILTVLMPCALTADPDAVQDAIYEAMRQ